jgi:hypothetical protein
MDKISIKTPNPNVAFLQEGSKKPTRLTVFPVYKHYLPPVKTTLRVWCLNRYLVDGVIAVKGHFLLTDLNGERQCFRIVNDANGSWKLFFPFFLGGGGRFFHWTVTNDNVFGTPTFRISI